MPGARGEFDRSLEAIEAKVIGLFAMLCEDLPRAAEALTGSGHGEAARVLAERERVIDALYLEVERLASREVLLQAPVAADLRFLLSVLRVTPELERSHDLVMQVAGRLRPRRPRRGPHAPRPRAHRPDERPRRRDVAPGRRSWYQRDRTAAAALAGHGQEMDELHASLAAELAAGQATAHVTMEGHSSHAATSALARTPSTSPAASPTSPDPQHASQGENASHPGSPGSPGAGPGHAVRACQATGLVM